MEKSRVRFNTHLDNQRNAYAAPKSHATRLSDGVTIAKAAVGAVILLIKANPLNPLSRIH